MPKGHSNIICPKCHPMDEDIENWFTRRGGTLTLRKAGNTKNEKYFYIKHFDRSAKHKSKSCYIGRSLAGVTLAHEGYSIFYNEIIDYMITQKYEGLDDKKKYSVMKEASDRLIFYGFPKRFVKDKIVADLAKSHLKRAYEDYERKGVLKDLKPVEFDSMLNNQVGVALREVGLA